MKGSFDQYSDRQQEEQLSLKRRVAWLQQPQQMIINHLNNGGGGATTAPPSSGGLSFMGKNNPINNNTNNTNYTNSNLQLGGLNNIPAAGLVLDRRQEDLVVPAVTVVLEGRSICHRISLHKHASYNSLAKALRQMFVDGGDGNNCNEINGLDLSNAVPGHLIAYEDMENDLLLAGDLSWKDFVRVAKRIRILPAKSNSRKGRGDQV